MTLDLDGFVARIAAAFPDLAFSRAVLIDRGADHAVVVLDDAWVFRFPRSAAYAATFPIELKLLRALRSRTPLAIPDYLRVAPRQAFGGYPLIVGRELTAPMFASLSRAAQETLLADLAAFMTALHDLPVDCVTGDDTVVKTDAGWAAEGAQSYFERRRPRVAEAVGPVTLRRLDRAHEDLPSLAWRRDAVIHGDLHDAHLLLDPAEDRLTGVIDFGDTAFGDAAHDFTFFWMLAGWTADFALDRYGRAVDRAGVLHRSRWSFVRYGVGRLTLALRRGEAIAAADIIEALVAALDALDL